MYKYGEGGDSSNKELDKTVSGLVIRTMDRRRQTGGESKRVRSRCFLRKRKVHV